MNVVIVHDSQLGNGKQVAERMGSTLESLGAKVLVGHQSETTPKQVAAFAPGLLIIGAAVRRFLTGPASKAWMSRLASEMKETGTTIAGGAIFITHIMPRKAVESRAGRFGRNIMDHGVIGKLHPDWFSGPVKKIPGPLVEGTLEQAEAYATTLSEWARSIAPGTE